MTQALLNSWTSVRDEVMRRIADGVWPPGGLIPGEAQLAQEFGCARATVNRALRDLAEAGLVIRRRKGGTRVAVHKVRKAVFDIPIIRHEIEQSDRAYRHVVLSRQKRRPSKIVAAKIGLPQHVPALHVRSLHLADNRPYMLEDRWLNLLAVPEIAAADLGEISINEWLVRNAPFTHGQLDFHAKTATPDEAEWLETEAGAALFVATRATWNGAQPITYVTMIYPPGHRMVTNL